MPANPSFYDTLPEPRDQAACLLVALSGCSPKRRVASFGKHPLAMKSDAFLREKRQSLAMQPAKLHHEPKTFAIPKIEGDNFVLGDAIEIAIGTKAKTARLAKFGQPFGTKDAHSLRRHIHGPSSRHGTLQMDTR